MTPLTAAIVVDWTSGGHPDKRQWIHWLMNNQLDIVKNFLGGGGFGGMGQVVEGLPSKYEALSSNPCTTNKKI
jgi:hypothetical protein